MSTGVVIKKNSYFDSVFLMQVAKGISNEPDIDQAIALMGTELNLKLTWRSFLYREDTQPGRLEKPSIKV